METVTPACLRLGNGGALCPCRLLGEAFAKQLEEPLSHQLGVTAELGINWRQHMRWMAAEYESGSQGEAYQLLVTRALDKQRRLDLEEMQNKLDVAHPAKATAQVNVSRFVHENRFKRFYGDEDVKRVELTGKDGGPLETAAVHYTVALPPEEEPDEEATAEPH